MFKKSKEFRALQAEWYKKLEEEGFKDIEETQGLDALKTYSNPRTRSDKPSANNERFDYSRMRSNMNTRYYDLCRQLQHTPTYIDMVERIPHYKVIWELFSEGKTHRYIAIQVGMHYNGVKYALNRIKKLLAVLIKEDNNDDGFDRD